MNKKTVLFLCTHNTARSQMAEAFLRRLGEEGFVAHSAGLNPAPSIHPLTIKVMEEIGYDLTKQFPKPLKGYLGNFTVDFVIFVCKKGEENCPYLWPTGLHGLSWPFEDPAATPDGEAALGKFREVRDQIEQKIRSWLRDFEKAPAGK